MKEDIAFEEALKFDDSFERKPGRFDEAVE